MGATHGIANTPGMEADIDAAMAIDPKRWGTGRPGYMLARRLLAEHEQREADKLNAAHLAKLEAAQEAAAANGPKKRREMAEFTQWTEPGKYHPSPPQRAPAVIDEQCVAIAREAARVAASDTVRALLARGERWRFGFTVAALLDQRGRVMQIMQGTWHEFLAPDTHEILKAAMLGANAVVYALVLAPNGRQQLDARFLNSEELFPPTAPPTPDAA